MDDIERARLEGAREALTALACELTGVLTSATLLTVDEFRDAHYPAPKPPLPTEPGSLLRLDDGVLALRDTSCWNLSNGAAFTDDPVRDHYPAAVQVFAKTRGEWDSLIAEARRKALDEADGRLSGLGYGLTHKIRMAIRELRDGEAS
jgi:hypothetical protein